MKAQISQNLVGFIVWIYVLMIWKLFQIVNGKFIVTKFACNRKCDVYPSETTSQIWEKSYAEIDFVHLELIR